MGRPVDVYNYFRPEGSDYNVPYEKVYSAKGKFIQYGVDYEELEYGVGNHSTAIVEMNDGSVENIPVELIIFI